MLKLKTFTALFMMLLVTSVTFGQSSEKILVKAFNLQGNKSVVLDLDGGVEVQEWNENYLRVQMTVEIDNDNEAMLKSLMKVGRYNLKGAANNGSFEITMPNTQKTVTVGGRELKETFSYVVYAPKNVDVSNKSEASAAVEGVWNAFR